MKCLRVQGRVAYLQKKVKTKKAKKLDILVKNSKFLDFGHVIILLKKKKKKKLSLPHCQCKWQYEFVSKNEKLEKILII